jgi:hypothetical protein
MMKRFDFDVSSSATTQLLAASLYLLSGLRVHPHLLLCVPIQVHRQLEPADYGRIIYDLLSADHDDLESRLTIQVHQKPFFFISSHSAGATNEIS